MAALASSAVTTSATSLQDPFYIVREEVEKQVRSVRVLFRRWNELRDIGQTQTGEYEFTDKELGESLKSLDWDLRDLRETISVVEENRSKYKLGDDELDKRKRFVQEIRDELGPMQAAMRSAEAKAAAEGNKRDQLFSGRGRNKHEKMRDAAVGDNQRLIDGELQQQALIERDQDLVLDDLSHTVTRIGQMGGQIHSELTTQNRMLEEMDQDVDDVEYRIKRARTMIKDIMKRSKNNAANCTIFLLTVLLITLFFLTFT